MEPDVPSPIDLRLVADAREWEANALLKRPSRPRIFRAFSSALSSAGFLGPKQRIRILELGSGPGYLAHQLMTDFADADYVAFDFSEAMHQLARERLAGFAKRIQYVTRSFREAGWADALGAFDAVVTHQAVHELRHKQHHVELHRAVRSILSPDGVYLVCDHFFGPGGQSNNQLYMSIDEQRESFYQAGFSRVQELLSEDGLVLHFVSE